MKLSEVASNNQFRKLLIYGDPGTGKSCFAIGFPKPMLVLDFDGKINSAAEFYRGEPWLDDVDVRVMLPAIEDLSVIKALGKDDYDPIDEFISITQELRKQIKDKNLKYKTIVIDSMTTLSNACVKHIIKTNPGIKRARPDQPGLEDYGILKREFLRFIPGLLSLPMNVVVTGHIREDKDEVTGAISRNCNTDGSFGKDMPIYFEEVYRSFVKDGKYLAQTQADYKYACRSQIRGLPKEINLAYESIKGV